MSERTVEAIRAEIDAERQRLLRGEVGGDGGGFALPAFGGEVFGGAGDAGEVGIVAGCG